MIVVPSALSSPPVVDAYPTNATLTWSPQSNCVLFNVYIILGDLKVPLNNGQGLAMTTPSATAQDVRLSKIFLKPSDKKNYFSILIFFSLLCLVNVSVCAASNLDQLHCCCVLW